MAETNQRIDELVFRSRVEGSDATKAALDGLAQSHGKAATAADAHARTTETVGKKMLDVERALANEQKRLAGAPQAWRDYERSIATASRALEQGKLDAEAYGRMVSEIQARLQKSIAPTVGLTVDQSGIAKILDGQKQVSAEARRAAKDLLGQAEAQQAAATEAARAQALLVDQAKRLRSELDPATAAQERLNQELARYQALADAGVIETHELAAAQAMANKRFEDAVKPMQSANDNVRLTSGQVQGLGYQLNDIGTMLASGSSPFQVLATQAGQIIQVLSDGPGGMRGSLSAIKDSIVDVIGAIGPMRIAMTAAAVVGGAFWLMSGEDEAEKAEKAIRSYDDAIKSLKASFADAGTVAEDFFDRAATGSVTQSMAQAQASIVQLKASLTAAKEGMASLPEITGLDALRPGASGALGELFGSAFGTQLSQEKARFRELYDQLVSGKKTAREFSDEVAEIRIDPATSQEGRKIADALLSAADAAELAEARIGALETGLDAAAVKALRMGEAYRAAMSGLAGLVPDLRTDAERINVFFDDMTKNSTRAGDEMVAQFMRRQAMAPITAEAKKLLDEARAAGSAIGLGEEAKAIAEVNARYAELTAQYKGNAEALIALEQWRAQSIDNAGKQARFDAGADAQKKADEDAKATAKATQSRLDGIRQTVAGLEAERAALGMSESEAEGYRFQMEALAAAKAAAAEAGTVVSQKEIDAIALAAGEVSRLTGEIDAMREAKGKAERLKEFMGDLDFDVSIANLPELEQDIQRQLRDLGVTAESVDGKRIAGQMRYLDSVRQVKDELGSLREAGVDAFTEMADAILSGESAMDALINTFAGLGRDLISAQLKDMFGGLYGQPGAGAVGVPAGIGSLPGVPSSLGGAGQGDAAAALASLNTNLDKAGGSALAVARQFEGLNERADSGALDAFLRASGTWKGLSTSDTAWCASFANAAIMKAGGQGTGSNMASSFMNWGTGTTTPQIGDIVVLKPQARGSSGHVGFVAGFGDGTVQVFGGNQRNAVNTRSFGLDQVAGYRTGAGTAMSADMLAQAVSVGNIDAARKAASGAVPGLSAWGPEFNDVQTVSPNVNLGGGIGAGGGGMGMGMTALGAGLGIFSAGAQSASPIMGALGGALGGFQAGAAMGAGLGPVGAVVGGIVGLVGGMFGKSKQKKQEEEARKQREAQQAQMAAQLASQIEDLETYFGRSPDDNMASELRDVDQKIRELRASIKNDGIASEDQVDQIERDAVAYKEMLRSEFRDVFEHMSADLGAGLGLESEFAKARESIRAVGKGVRGWVEDSREAFRVPTELRDAILDDFKAAEAAANKDVNAATSRLNRVRRGSSDDYTIDDRKAAEKNLVEAEKSRAAALKTATAERDKALAEYEATVAEMQRRYDEAVATAMRAASDALLRAISGDVLEQTDIEKALDQSRGAAAAAGWELQQLGHSAEEAGRRIEEALGQRATRLREDFTKSLQDQINDLDGKGYIASIRDLLEERDDLLKDAGLVGADPALVSAYFAKAAQDIVDGSSLAVSAFDELIALFPELAGVVRRVSVDFEALKSRIEGYDDRRFAATVDTSTLAGAMADFNRRATRERYAEGLAGGEGMLALDAALAAEKVATIQRLLVQARQEEVSEIEATISRLDGLTREWSDLRRSLKLDDNLSNLNAEQRFLEAQRQFRETAAKAAAGDEEAQAELAGISREYLDESRSFWGSSAAYYAAFDEVQNTLANAETIAASQLTTAKSQLEMAKAQLNAMEGVKDSVTDLAKALALAVAEMKAAAVKAGVPALDLGTGTGTGTGTGGTGGTGSGAPSFTPTNDLEHFLGVQYQAILGRAPDAAGVAYYQALRDQGATADQLIAYIKNSPEAKGRGFMGGGYTGPGPRHEVAGRVHRGEVVFNQDDVARAGGVAAVEAMRLAPIPAPVMRLPKISMPGLPHLASSDAGASRAEIAGLRRDIARLGDRLGDIIMASDAETRATLERGNRIAGQTSDILQLDREAA
ncbi:TIGR02594 family protein [Antarcticirhabdus aurantiaca]|uniref:TIGR02594 family protein n=1 Tax=Antarcticirhabdus aurantiaca TaxID=2606717 RepID=A0ACD4NR87_9HYPH|nr:TIGR02594 family protein [Jeongeuplla avenae]